MRKFLISAAVLSASLAAAAPATAAQNYRGGDNIKQQLDQIEDRIERAEQRRAISHREAQQLDNRVDRLEDLYDRYRRNGLTRNERQDLQQRINSLRQQIRFERNDGNRHRR